MLFRFDFLGIFFVLLRWSECSMYSCFDGLSILFILLARSESPVYSA